MPVRQSCIQILNYTLVLLGITDDYFISFDTYSPGELSILGGLSEILETDGFSLDLDFHQSSSTLCRIFLNSPLLHPFELLLQPTITYNVLWFMETVIDDTHLQWDFLV